MSNAVTKTKLVSEDLKRAFGIAVKARRNRMGISQDELAWRATVHRTYITNVERGICNPSLGSIAKIARALGTSTALLLADLEIKPGQAQPKPVDGAFDILLVEDDVHDAELTVQALKSAALVNTVEIARDGEEALHYLFGSSDGEPQKTARRPGLVLLDLNLPKVSGMEVLQRMKSEPSTESIPVVILTVSKMHTDVKECLRLGASAYMVKPVNFRGLSEVAPQLNLSWVLLRSTGRIAV
jgi:two-component system response regulator